jgi:hypothetical protein
LVQALTFVRYLFDSNLFDNALKTSKTTAQPKSAYPPSLRVNIAEVPRGPNARPWFLCKLDAGDRFRLLGEPSPLLST